MNISYTVKLTPPNATLETRRPILDESLANPHDAPFEFVDAFPSYAGVPITVSKSNLLA
jgi:hypothetical protein